MSLDTYTNLQTAIGNWLNRSDLTSNIPDFISVAEAQMRRRFKKSLFDGQKLPRPMLTKNAAFAIASGTEFVAVPGDFLGGVESFYLDPQTVNGQKVGAIQIDYISPMNMEYLKQKRGPGAANDEPSLYTIAGSQFQFLPIPDNAYTAVLFYWQDFNNLAVANGGVNWILTSHPDVYLYGALTAAAPFLMDDERTQMWATLFENGVDDLIKSDPIPSDRAWLRMEAGLTFRPNSMTAFDINSGDFIHGI